MEVTNVSQDGVITQKEIGFVICEQLKCHPHNLFGGQSSNLLNQPLNVDSWPKTHNGKTIQHNLTFKLSKNHENRWEAKCVSQATILPPMHVPSLEYGLIYNITSNVPQTIILKKK
jgi:hypothetical protein